MFLAMFLAHFLYRNATPNSKSLNGFKEAIITGLVGELPQPKYLRPVTNFHYLAPKPPTAKKQRPTKKCVFCNVPGQEVIKKRDASAHTAKNNLLVVLIRVFHNTTLIWVLRILIWWRRTIISVNLRNHLTMSNLNTFNVEIFMFKGIFLRN